MTSIYNINIDVPNDIINMIYDIIKFSIIQIITHLLFYFNNLSISFFNIIFFQTLIFINLGLMVFWLLFKKIINFNNNNNNNKIKEKKKEKSLKK
tara:strand:- start:969 stop:1253 length:285 start_codon:yes stop_codon:yes gene_type:complete